jgi:hypothetical protein
LDIWKVLKGLSKSWRRNFLPRNVSQAGDAPGSQRRELIEIITTGRFLKSRRAKKSPECHGLYRPIRDKDFATESLSWPSYIILHALYHDDLPHAYVGHIEQKFGTTVIEDFSDAFFKYYPREGAFSAALAEGFSPEDAATAREMLLAPVVDILRSEQGKINKWYDDFKANKGKSGTTNDDLPVSKRQKRSHKPNTQKTQTTTQRTPKATTANNRQRIFKV